MAPSSVGAHSGGRAFTAPRALLFAKKKRERERMLRAIGKKVFAYSSVSSSSARGKSDDDDDDDDDDNNNNNNRTKKCTCSRARDAMATRRWRKYWAGKAPD